MTTDKIIAAAREAGGTPYTNRHYPGETACAFGPESLARFYAIAYRAGMERAAEIAEGMREENGPHAYAWVIRSHAKNQPESTHDTGNV